MGNTDQGIVWSAKRLLKDVPKKREVLATKNTRLR
jgi:hypothetical protein